MVFRKGNGEGKGRRTIHDGDERGVENGPDNVEFPLQVLDPDGSYFDDHDCVRWG